MKFKLPSNLILNFCYEISILTVIAFQNIVNGHFHFLNSVLFSCMRIICTYIKYL